MANNQINCPKCGVEISIDDVLTHQLEKKIKQAYEAKQKQKDLEINTKEQELLAKQKQIDSAKENLVNIVNKKVAENLQIEKDKLKLQLKEEIEKEKAGEVKFLSEQLLEKDKKLEESRQAELDLRKEKNQLEEDKKSFEVEKQRQLDEERKNIYEEASKKASAEEQFKLLELKKQLNDVSKVNEELKRKLQQGSQQTQGEVLELELEDLLKKEFPRDEILPVGKGINGADITQKIIDNYGHVCGTIVWESKHTKNWTEGWVQKLKDDQRNEKAEIAVIVTTVLPKEIKTFGLKDGVWVTDFVSVVGLAIVLRSNIIQLNSLKLASVGKNEKMEMLFNYLSGTEFKQKIETIVEAFGTMKEDLEKEKKVYTKMWESRDKQISRVVESTIGMYGSLEGLMGKSLPKIDVLELPEEL
ncbi:MAG: DUF2130 domain-containing protein [Candidatus Shapirobacteria bacterium]|nr:DUF2130 domain-containing protein [Candidatus Shapirobacteria bacterium]